MTTILAKSLYLTTLLILLVFANSASAALSSHYLKYRIEYYVGFFPLSGKIDQVLTNNNDGTWMLKRSGLIYGFQAKEISSFFYKGNDIVPRWYLRNQTGIFKDNFSEVNFDLQAKPRVYDPITLSLRIALDLQRNPKRKEFSYLFTDKQNKSERKIYQVTGKEIIKTPIGKISTVVVERKPGDEVDREFIYWLAPKLNYLIVRLRTIEKGEKKIEINIKSGSVGKRRL